jgi:hypothetical protein
VLRSIGGEGFAGLRFFEFFLTNREGAKSAKEEEEEGLKSNLFPKCIFLLSSFFVSFASSWFIRSSLSLW